ncbi:DUF4214 domain-containing protein [Duganella aquatilis]|nr:DUF4214 domain-containing protein [Duganella aquatilis]
MTSSANTAPKLFNGQDGLTYLKSISASTRATNHVVLNDGKILVTDDSSFWRFNADGSVDQSFGNGGTASFSAVAPSGGYTLGAMMKTPDGKVLVSSTVKVPGAANGDLQWVVMRLDEHGVFDPTYANGAGRTYLNSSIIREFSKTMMVQPDGKVLITGFDDSFTVLHGLVVGRLNPDGTPDTGFGTAGMAVVPDLNGTVRSTGVLADGKILVLITDYLGGYSLVRLLNNGKLDTSFAFNGVLHPTDMSNNTSLLALPDGGFLLSGYAMNPATGDGVSVRGSLVRYTASGDLDQAWGQGGRMLVDLSKSVGLAATPTAPSSTFLGAMQVDSQGRILLIASTGTSMGSESGKEELLLVRFRADGSLDDNFGHGGVQVLAGPLNFIYPDPMQIAADGTISIVGQQGNWGANYFADNFLLQLGADGKPLASFGAGDGAVVNEVSLTPGLPVVLAAHIQVRDKELDASNYAGAMLVLTRHGGANAGDGFVASGAMAFKDGKVVMNGVEIGNVSSNAGTLQINFNERASNALVNKVLQSIAYTNPGNAVASDVQLDWKFSDGSLESRFSTTVHVGSSSIPYWITRLLDTGKDTPAELVAHLHDAMADSNDFKLKFNGASTADQAAIKAVMADIANVANLKFGKTGIDLLFQHSAIVNADKASVVGLIDDGAAVYYAGTGKATLLHALGHVLGLQDANSGSPSVMADAAALSATDIAALQYLYGPSPTERSGNDTYRPDTATANFIWDGGGNDTISLAGSKQGVTLHLEPGHWDWLVKQGPDITAPGQITVNFGSVIENAIGGDGNDTLYGTATANILAGGAGDDMLVGLGGGDTLDGGAGVDVAGYAGVRANYTVNISAQGVSVSGGGLSAPDTLKDVERIAFADAIVAVDVDGVAGKAFRLYQAAFDRLPDSAGLGLWITLMDKGMSLNAAAQGFIQSEEFAGKFGGHPDAQTFVSKLYQNVLHRAGEPAGLAFWTGLLERGTLSMADVLIGFSESAENQAQVVGSVQHGIGYTPWHG